MSHFRAQIVSLSRILCQVFDIWNGCLNQPYHFTIYPYLSACFPESRYRHYCTRASRNTVDIHADSPIASRRAPWSKMEKYFTKHFAFDPTWGEDECTQMRATSAMQLRHTSIPRTCCASFISVLIRSMSVKPAISRRTVDKVDRY